jgi:hypothetical protein
MSWKINYNDLNFNFTKRVMSSVSHILILRSFCIPIWLLLLVSIWIFSRCISVCDSCFFCASLRMLVCNLLLNTLVLQLLKSIFVRRFVKHFFCFTVCHSMVGFKTCIFSANVICETSFNCVWLLLFFAIVNNYMYLFYLNLLISFISVS